MRERLPRRALAAHARRQLLDRSHLLHHLRGDSYGTPPLSLLKQILAILIIIGHIRVNRLKREEEARARLEEEEAMRAGGSMIMGKHAV